MANKNSEQIVVELRAWADHPDQIRNQIKKLGAKLKECLAKRGEAYVLGGDGWHDNPAFEALEAEYDFLQSRIRQTKNELLELQTEKR